MLRKVLLSSTLCAVLHAAGAAAQQSEAIVIDHQKRTASLTGASQRVIESEGEVRIRRGTDIPVRIDNTNSALYTCTLTQSRAPVPEVEQTKSFLTAFGSYLTTGGLLDALTRKSLFSPPASGVTPVDSRLQGAVEAVQMRLSAIQGVVARMNDDRLRTLASLQRMSAPGASVSGEATDLRRQLGCEIGACGPRPYIQATIYGLGELIPAAANLEQSLRASPNPTEVASQTAEDARKVVESADAIVAAAYATDRLVRIVSGAQPSIDCEHVKVSGTAGRTMVITVAPRALPETQRIADRTPMEFKATALPRRRVTPVVSVALIAAPAARFTKFGTVPAPGDSAEIIETGTQDSRFTYGLTLGARLPRFGPGDDFAIYPVELTVNPTDDVKAIGFGTAASYKAVKLGVGMLWTRHSVLDAQSVGDRLRHSAFLRTEDRYDSKPYLSFTVVGWPPFLSAEKK